MITTGGGGQHDASTAGSVCAELANTGCARQWASRASRAGEAPTMRQWERPLQHASRSSSSAVVTWPLAGLAPLLPFLPAAPAHCGCPSPPQLNCTRASLPLRLTPSPHQHTSTCTLTHTHSHSHSHTHSHTLIHTHAHTQTHSHSHSNTH